MQLKCNLCWTDILFGFISVMLKHNGMSRLIIQVRESVGLFSQKGFVLENFSQITATPKFIKLLQTVYSSMSGHRRTDRGTGGQVCSGYNTFLRSKGT
jgi:hypothetical protein